MTNIGKEIWSRSMAEKGTIINKSHRICAACGYSPCYIVRWSDGKITKPCIKGVGYENNKLKLL